jgi:hypothetical protein
MSKTQTAEYPSTPNVEELLATVAALAKQVETLTSKQQDREDEDEGPQRAKTSNARAQLLVSQVGDIIQAEGYTPPVPERVALKGPAAIDKYLKQWNRGQGVNARQISDSDTSLAESAHM